MLDLAGDPPGSHGFGIGCVMWFVRLVRTGVSLRGTSRVLELLSSAAGDSEEVPDWTTGRLWLQRLGHAKLTALLPQADDWAWLVDHSVQIGEEKCLVILGIRLGELPPEGECLQHEQMELVMLLPKKSWTKQDVDEVLESSVVRTGVPRVIVNDHGADIAGGVSLFQQRHTNTVDIYDMKHKAACLLKRRLETNARWKEFQAGIGRTRCAIQQTELAYLGPPGTRQKSRYMNLDGQLKWATNILKILASLPDVRCDTSPERIHEKLGWVAGFSTEVHEWHEWQMVVDTTVKFVNQSGHHASAADALRRELPSQYEHKTSRQLAEELLAFVTSESAKAAPNERLPGSTEILESCFGRFKALEKDQARGGFTSLLLAFGALLTKTTQDTIQGALKHSHTKDVIKWCRDNLGQTLFAKRKLAFQACATKDG